MSPHELKLLLQDHLTDGLVTVVGSGLSCAEGLPGMGVLASHLVATLPARVSESDQPTWTQLAPLIQTEGLEAALLKVKASQELEAELMAAVVECILPLERAVISEVVSGKRVLRFTRLISHLLKPQTGIPVVTPNYDRLIEVATEAAGLGVDTMFVGDYIGTFDEKESRHRFLREARIKGNFVRRRFADRLTLFKPHGSLDWYAYETGPIRHPGELPLPRLVITPGINKFRNGYDSPFDKHREKANDAIDQASKFLVIGYGFNDDHLETHLSPRIKGGVSTVMLARSLSVNARRLAMKHSNVIAISQAPKPSDGGSTVIQDCKASVLPDINLWDLGGFISKVLEP